MREPISWECIVGSIPSGVFLRGAQNLLALHDDGASFYGAL